MRGAHYLRHFTPEYRVKAGIFFGLTCCFVVCTVSIVKTRDHTQLRRNPSGAHFYLRGFFMRNGVALCDIGDDIDG